MIWKSLRFEPEPSKDVTNKISLSCNSQWPMITIQGDASWKVISHDTDRHNVEVLPKLNGLAIHCKSSPGSLSTAHF